jgi:hypothetical protein
MQNTVKEDVAIPPFFIYNDYMIFIRMVADRGQAANVL